MKATERNAILQSLRNGVVPRLGLEHIVVGRKPELEQIVKDLDMAARGGATMRFVIGDYGAGKTFFLTLAKIIALKKRFIVMTADVTNERRLAGGDGQAVALFSELTRNLATSTQTGGGALKNMIERFISSAADEAEKTEKSTRDVIRARLGHLQDLVAGFDFADVLNAYYEGYELHDEDRQQAALKWLRGEFHGKLDARKALGVKSLVEDDRVYEYLKLFAAFAKLSGYAGLMVCLDELAAVHSLSSATSRQQAYDQILRILNDINQGSTEYLTLLLGGTRDFLEDERRGIYSHDALQTRLAPNKFARNGLIDTAHPVMQLQNLTRDDLANLLSKVRSVHAFGSSQPAFDNADIPAFLDHQLSRVGASAFATPRETVKEFIELLSVLEQNPGRTWRDVMGLTEAAKANGAASSKEDGLADLQAFRL